MSLGYSRPLYLLPFDHRQSYVTGMFQFTPPLHRRVYQDIREGRENVHSVRQFSSRIGALITCSPEIIEERSRSLRHNGVTWAVLDDDSMRIRGTRCGCGYRELNLGVADEEERVKPPAPTSVAEVPVPTNNSEWRSHVPQSAARQDVEGVQVYRALLAMRRWSDQGSCLATASH